MFGLELLPVVLNKVKLFSMTVARVEVVPQHLRVRLVIVPVVVIHTVYRSHHSGAMASASAVHVKLAGRRTIGDPQKLAYLRSAGILLVNDRNVNVAHASCFNRRLFLLP